MVAIHLHQPGKINCAVKFPSQWNELFPQEVLEICRQQLKEGNTQAMQKAAILKYIINLRSKYSKKKLPAGWMNLLDAEQAVMQGYPLLDFIYNDNTLTNQPEQCISLRRYLFNKKYYGPGNTFENVTCAEFEDASIFFNQFYIQPDGNPLAQIAAILWRPQKNKKRVPYCMLAADNLQLITYNADKKVKQFIKLRPWRLYAILTWYAGCFNLLQKLFPTVYEKHGNKKEEVDVMAFTKCIHAGAGPKNGNRQHIRLMKLYEFMFDMEQEAIKAKELEKLYNAQK